MRLNGAAPDRTKKLRPGLPASPPNRPLLARPGEPEKNGAKSSMMTKAGEMFNTVSAVRQTAPAQASGQRPPSQMSPWTLIALSALTAAAILIPGLIVQQQSAGNGPSSEAAKSGYGASSAAGAERQPMFAASGGQLVPLLGGAADAPGSETAPPGGSGSQTKPKGDPSGTNGTASNGGTDIGTGNSGTDNPDKTPDGTGANGGTPQNKPGSNAGGGSVSEKGASEQTASLPSPGALDRMIVRVYLTAEKRVEKVPMELYVRGVLAGEMPVTFEPEALKAQAIAARTYMVKRLASEDRTGMPVDNADVTDTTAHQVYVPLKKLLNRWSDKEQKANLDKLNAAVQQTRSQIITYEGQPIDALFFSTSNGYTENSEDYWGSSLPYLRSVSSPWDKKISPEFKETTKMSLAAFYKKLGVSGRTSARSMRVLDTTDGRRIREMTVGDKVFTGRQVREKLGLASTQFTWKITGKEIEITTFGYGHGVGMSQWGADGMAKNGSTAYQILSHYYTGTEVIRTASLPRTPV
ncbi:stage II sporulation protein D [Paenibacillus pasadenensis]|nr:stage II sporulation protein D [Paenibacillus pasadenensis]